MRLLLLLGCLPIVWSVDWDVTTPLDEYVNRPDDSYDYHYVADYDFSNIEGLGCRIWVVNYTSQRWMTPEFSSRSSWWHWLVVALPATETQFRFPDAAFLLIDAGGNTRTVPPEPNGWKGTEINGTCRYASEVGTAAALLTMIPNQPIVFAEDSEGRERTEDATIAWTWRRFINDTSDYEPILQLPMTKGAVRGMDTINNIVQDQYPQLDTTVDRFMVGGGSKRGWIAWLCGAVDKRVVAVTPMVLSSVNLVKNFKKHYESLGGWSWVLRDYYEEEIFAFMDQPVFQKLADIIDPYEYRERLTMPIVVISATGDEFFLPDDSHLFFDDLPGQKFMMLCQNNDHTLPTAQGRILDALRPFFYAVLSDEISLPELTWKRYEGESSGSIIVHSKQTPRFVVGWKANTMHPIRRDFRYKIAGGGVQDIKWLPRRVEHLGNNTYALEVDYRDDDGFTGFLINVLFDGPNGWNFDFTTEVHIIRDELPFEPCYGWGCMEGDMV